MGLTKNRAALAPLRGKRSPEQFALWMSEFGEGNAARAARYALAVESFLGEGTPGAVYTGKLSPNTRRAYSFALNEFFEWLATERGGVVPPHRVTRADAENYANWLATRPYTLTQEKLKDGDSEVRLRVFELVQQLGSTDRKSILAAGGEALKAQLGAQPMERLTHELGRMVLHNQLTRSPSVEELRKEHPRAGIDQFEIELTPGRILELGDVFLYSIPPSMPVSRSTILLRLAALSSFWDVLAQGENIPGGEPLLQHNIFKPVKQRVQRGSRAERRAASAEQRIDPQLVPALVRTAENATTLVEKRDRALFFLLLFAGVRAEEAAALRRGKPPVSEEKRWPGWIEGEPPVLHLLRKGGKRMVLPYPSIALRALRELELELRHRAAPADAQSQYPFQANYVHPNSPRWRYRELVTMNDAPLLPPVNYWGANSTEAYQPYRPNVRNSYGPPDYRRSLTLWGLTVCLKRLAARAGLSATEAAQVHPHAFRHFAATAMEKGGKSLREIQTILGHDSITTTETYLEPPTQFEALSGQTEILEYIAKFGDLGGTAPARREPPAPEVVETYAAPPEEPPVAPPAAPTPLQEVAAIQAAEPAYEAAEQVGGELPPTHDLPAAPAVGEAPVEAIATARGEAVVEGGQIVALDGEPPPSDVEADMLTTQIVAGKSPGSPKWVYEHLAKGEPADAVEFTKRAKRAGRDGVTIDTEKGVEYVQDAKANPILAQHYDPWPPNYGIGRESLLVWFAKGNPGKDGWIRGTDPLTNKPVKVPPLPVLAPAQVFDETTTPTMLDFVEQLYNEWLNGNPELEIAPSPTRTYGLARWWGFFSYTTAKLQRWLRLKREESPSANVPEWRAFNVVAEVGTEVRAHDEAWLQDWFRENAHTYTTSRRFFKSMVPRGKGEARSREEFWKHFDTAAIEGVAFVAELPAWFAENDPVHAIYEADPKEWERFSRWIANVTGQKLSKQRKSARKQAETEADQSWEEKRDEARELLTFYFKEIVQPIGMIRNYLRGRGPESPAEESLADELGLVGMSKSDLAAQMRIFQDAKERYVSQTLAKLGIPDPATEEGYPRDLKARVIALVDKHMPAEPGLDSPNVFRGSELFEAGFFQIDDAAKTITHTDEYRERFAERFDGRDSELVLRRAARAMWAWAKEHAGVLEQPTESQYGMLYSVMLMYISWIVPAPQEMERQALAAGKVSLQPEDARRQWLEDQAQAMRALAYGGLGTLLEGTEELTLTDQEALDAIMSKFQLSEEQAKLALDLIDLQQAESAEIERWAGDEAIVREIAQSIGPEGNMRVFRSHAEAEKERQQERAVTRLKKAGGLTPNRGTTLEFIVGERCETWYVIRGSEFTENPSRLHLISPSAVARKKRLLANARPVLPSPFRAIAAMAMAEAETSQKTGWL